MRTDNPRIIYDELFFDLTDDEKTDAMLIDISRHLYAVLYARDHAIGTIQDEASEVFEELEKHNPEIAREIAPIIKPCFSTISKNIDKDKCKQAANRVLIFVVTGGGIGSYSEPRTENPSDLARHAVESDTSSEIIDEKPLASNNLAVISFHPTMADKWKVTVLNKKGKPISTKRLMGRADAEVLFDSLE